jgi:hypothetical protein
MLFLHNDVWAAGLNPEGRFRALTTIIAEDDFEDDFEDEFEGEPGSYRLETVQFSKHTLHAPPGLNKGFSVCLQILLHYQNLDMPHAHFIRGIEPVSAALRELDDEGINVLVYPENIRPRQALQLFCGPLLSTKD